MRVNIGISVVRTDARSLGVRSRDYHIFWDEEIYLATERSAARGAPLQYKNTYKNCKLARKPRRNQRAYIMKPGLHSQKEILKY